MQAPVDIILQRYKERIHPFVPKEEAFTSKVGDVDGKTELPEKDLLQGKFTSGSIPQNSTMPLGQNSHSTGLPDFLKGGIESLSGYNMDDVKVHYNSEKPARVNSLAYAQGTNIYVAPGQESYLPHEAWHVVQQKQGRVQPTLQLQGVNVNDNKELENEADKMGSQIIQMKPGKERLIYNSSLQPVIQRSGTFVASVSLRESEMKLYDAGQLTIDTIKLSGRADTGLKKENNKTQGDHTIADVFIKKHQKIMSRDKTISEFLLFYEDMNTKLIEDSKNFAKNHPDHNDVLNRSEEFVQEQAANNNDLIYIIRNVKLPMYRWRKELQTIITNYNDAYSHSRTATIYNENRPTGKGEGSAMKYLKNNILNNNYDGEKIEKIESLLDKSAIEESGEDIDSFKDKFYGMVNDMQASYKEHTDVKEQYLNSIIGDCNINKNEEDIIKDFDFNDWWLLIKLYWKEIDLEFLEKIKDNKNLKKQFLEMAENSLWLLLTFIEMYNNNDEDWPYFLKAAAIDPYLSLLFLEFRELYPYLTKEFLPITKIDMELIKILMNIYEELDIEIIQNFCDFIRKNKSEAKKL